MKYALVVLAFVAASTAWEFPNVGRGELAKEFQDFLDRIPQEKVVAITLEYYANDEEFQAMVAYFKSKEFKTLIQDIEALDEVKELLDYAYEAGLDSYKMVNEVNKFLELPPIPTPKIVKFGKQISGGIRGYIDDIEELIDVDGLHELAKEKMKKSPVFQDYVEKMRSGTFQEIIDQVAEHPKFQKLLDHAREVEVDIARIQKVLSYLFGVVFPYN